MVGKLAQILAAKADLQGGKIPPQQIPVEEIFTEKLINVNRIILSSTPPENPQVNDLWIDISE